MTNLEYLSFIEKQLTEKQKASLAQYLIGILSNKLWDNKAEWVRLVNEAARMAKL